ncbi:MAG: hypothetical protein COB73_08310 [Flavobacteriaceae bacterium]|nr:MAG: hypothetical protein COB73_08310 [Flavobacteriaceae bacterium]
MKLKLPFFVLLILIFLSSCKKEKVGGACTYDDVTKKVNVTFVDGDLNGEFMVSFQPIGVDTDEVYRMTDKQFKKVKRNFDLEALQNKSSVFELSIEEITKGTCTPFIISEIMLE